MRIPFDMTVLDCTFILVSLFLGVWTLFMLPNYVLSGTDHITISADSKAIGRYSFEENRIVEAEGPLGRTIVEIKNQEVRIVSSPCPNKTCVHMGAFGKNGGFLLCLPNKILIHNTQKSLDVDAVTR